MTMPQPGTLRFPSIRSSSTAISKFGAQPKANVANMNANLWLSKCPGRNDMYDTGGWEMIAWELTKRFGLNVTKTTIGKFSGNGYKFLTKRFDRIPGRKKIHFASAMKLLEYLDRTNYKDGPAIMNLQRS